MKLFNKVLVPIALLFLLSAETKSQRYFDDFMPNDPFLSETVTNNRSRTIIEMNHVYQWGSNPHSLPWTNIVKGDTLFVCHDNEFMIYDISNLNNIQQIGSIQTPYNSASWSSSKIFNNYLFHLNSYSGMHVYDISDISQSSLIYSTDNDFTGRPYDIAFQDSIAFLAARQGGLMACDISNINEITFIDTFFTENHIDAVITLGDKIIIGDRNHTLTVLDYDVENGFSLVSQTQNDYLWAWKFKKRNNIIYVLNAPSSGWNGISTYDMSNPEIPVFIDSTLSVGGGGAWNFEITFDQQNIFCPIDGGIMRYQLDNNGHIISSIFHQSQTIRGTSISISNNTLITSDARYLSMHSFQQNSINEINVINLNDGSATDLALSENVLAAFDDNNNLIHLFDISNMPTISENSIINIPEINYQHSNTDFIRIVENHLTLLSPNDNKIEFYNISDLSYPEYISTFSGSEEKWLTDYIFDGNKIITVGSFYQNPDTNQFSIDFINTSDISNPYLEHEYLINRYNTHPYYNKLLDLNNDTLTCVYIDNNSDSIHIYMLDISNITDPQMIAENHDLQISSGWSDSKIVRCDEYLYINRARGNPWFRISYNNEIVVDTLYDYVQEYEPFYNRFSCSNNFIYSLDQADATTNALLFYQNNLYKYASASTGYGVSDLVNFSGYNIVSNGENGISIFEEVGSEIIPFTLEIENQVINEDSSLSLVIDIINAGVGEALINVISNEEAVFSDYNYNSSILNLQPLPNWFGTTVIDIQAFNDGGDDTTTNSFTLNVIPINDAPYIDSLLSPTIIDTFSTHPFSDQDILFSWNGGDVDDDEMFTLTIDLEFFGNTYTSVYEEIADSSFTLPASELDPLLVGLNLDNSILSWYIETADTQYTVISSIGQFVLIRDQLSTIENNLVPEVFALHQNYPNPFNPVTSLRYDLPEDGLVNITIYDMMGRIVKTLVNSSQKAGYKSIIWNATNNRNESVSAGLYLYTIQAGEFRQTRKMVLLK